jgi:hypothetical protein
MFIESSFGSLGQVAHETAWKHPHDAKRKNMTRAGPDRFLTVTHDDLDET